ncbi:MAG: hypothetical protein JXA97_12380 [Anaerolineales bacterium]|nr:hypothetical protein [Anaerolineales bacterium]
MEPLAHASIALMAKPIAPKAPLWALIAATQVPDLRYFGFSALGIEDPGVSTADFTQGLSASIPPTYPWSHGFFMCIVWSVIVAAISYAFLRDRRTSLILGGMVFSHWVLDFIVYATLPLMFVNSPRVGLGLLNSGPGLVFGILVEISLIVTGLAIYLSSRKRTAILEGE